MPILLPIELTNGFGDVYLTITYNSADHWVYATWVGYQTDVGILTGAKACLQQLQEHACSPTVPR